MVLSIFNYHTWIEYENYTQKFAPTTYPIVKL